jgi:hypothetical protein
MHRFLLLFTLILTGCASEWYARTSAVCPVTADQVVYLVGDFGKDSPILQDVGAALAGATAQDADLGPTVLALGDNLYQSGLSRCAPAACYGSPEAQNLRDVAQRFGDVQGNVFLLPGNHDYHSNALDPDPPGDITHWYFLKDLGVEAPWRPLLGDASEFKNPDALYHYLYHPPPSTTPAQQLTDFLAPRPVVATDQLLIVGIDSQLLIDLYRGGQDTLANEYLEDLRQKLKPQATWKAVAAHHPLETYGKHRVAQPMRLLFGPGWPQFPEPWQKLTAVPGLGTLVTLGWWARHSPQNIHSGPYDRYRKGVYDVLQAEGVALFLAGHDHNTQLIELSAVFKDPSAHPLLQVLTGEAAKEDPVGRGRGSLAYHTGGGFVRLAFDQTQLCVEMRDRHGLVRYRHAVKPSSNPDL